MNCVKNPTGIIICKIIWEEVLPLDSVFCLCVSWRRNLEHFGCSNFKDNKDQILFTALVNYSLIKFTKGHYAQDQTVNWKKKSEKKKKKKKKKQSCWQENNNKKEVISMLTVSARFIYYPTVSRRFLIIAIAFLQTCK